MFGLYKLSALFLSFRCTYIVVVIVVVVAVVVVDVIVVVCRREEREKSEVEEIFVQRINSK